MNKIHSDSSFNDNMDSGFEPLADTGGATENDGQGYEESNKGSFDLDTGCRAQAVLGNNSNPNASTYIPRSVRVTTRTTPPLLPVDNGGAFSFLQLESYICTCTSQSVLCTPKAPTSTGGRGSAPADCKVLLYFGMLFLADLHAIFCPAHHCFVPMACWVDHVSRCHQDWISSTKIKECDRMAQHVALSCGLKPTQDTGDILLPVEIDQSFRYYSTLLTKAARVHLSFQCPKCSHWIAEDKSSRQSDRYMRRHLKDSTSCSKASPDWETIQLAEPRHIYRISLSRGKYHAFLLPMDWDDTTKVKEPEPTRLPKFSLSDDTFPSFLSRTVSQDWPFTLGWTAYDEDISASKHIIALRQLILRPKYGHRSKTRNPDFLEEGLCLVNHALIKYFKAAMMFVHKKHKSVVDAIVSDSTRSSFRMLSDGTIRSYRRPFSMVISMMLRFIHAVLIGDGSRFGPFKLRGVETQFEAAMLLYRLFAEHADNVHIPEDRFHWALHNLLVAFLQPEGLGNRVIDSPIDQMLFLWSLLPNGHYRIPVHLQALLAGCKCGFRCISIHLARVDAHKQQQDKLVTFYQGLSVDDGAAMPVGDEVQSDDDSDNEVGETPGGNMQQDEPNIDITTVLKKLRNMEPSDVIECAAQPPSLEQVPEHSHIEQVTDPLILGILTENQHWLSNLPSYNHAGTTPYSRVHDIMFVIGPYALQESSLTQFDVNRDGQAVSYTRDGVVWHSTNFQDWSNLLQAIMLKIDTLVCNQLPTGMTITDLMPVDRQIVDDYSNASPHLQDPNRAWMEEIMEMFRSKMLSSNEERHQLFKDGKPVAKKIHQYIQNDQKIRGLLSALLAVSSSVTMRAFQFKSIIVDGCDGFNRNVWIVGNRFITGKPKAKQINALFADVLFWFPRMSTPACAVLLFYQKPLICSLLTMLGIKASEHRYASHLWPLPPSTKGNSMVWEGPLISKTIRDISREVIKAEIDPALVRQMAEGVFRDKIPSLFEVFQSHDNLNLEKGGYRFSGCLGRYANYHGLHGLANAADMSADRAAACLIVVDIWQCMHKLEPCDAIWQPMVENSYIFPTTIHQDLAYLEAQNLKQTVWVMYRQMIDQGVLTRGLSLLAESRFSEVIAFQEEDQPDVTAGKIFLQVMRCILFGNGRPRYAQTPPIGGILLEDIVKAGGLILLAPTSYTDGAIGMAKDEEIYKTLRQEWGSSSDFDWIAISANVFDVRPMTNPTTITLSMEI
ncbi:hypothetical protein EDB83DRAFT_2322272 [Lactarius deliciosus]|nr:hypothetical protein EDB83DRAFT_2322272 [Lactarius deliciosus]